MGGGALLVKENKRKPKEIKFSPCLDFINSLVSSSKWSPKKIELETQGVFLLFEKQGVEKDFWLRVQINYFSTL